VIQRNRRFTAAEKALWMSKLTKKLEKRHDIPPGLWALMLILFVATLGCNRAHYRCQADWEVYGAVACATADPRWNMSDFTIQPDPASRMYDPDDDDAPPMPPDDPESHELMHRVDGKRGWKHWHRNGDTPYVENPIWRVYLPRDENGIVTLDRQGAMQLALLHSRQYQSQLEELYLSALQVTFERFRFDTQFFGGTTTSYTADGPLRAGNSQSTLSHLNQLEARRLLASGGELIVGLANSLVWQFSSPNTYHANTLLDFSLMQPLLRAGGRAVVLERLTAAERTLLANVRQMEQFRRGFYTEIVAGRNAGPGPSRGGIGIPAISAGTGGIGGFLALLQRQIVIRNQQVNVQVVQSNLDQLDALFRFNRLDSRTGKLQVEQARQQLLDSQSQLVALEADYGDRLDSFKVLLGLPPDLEVSIADPLLDRFNLIASTTSRTSEMVSRLLGKLRQKDEPLPPNLAAEIDAIRQNVLAQLNVVAEDLKALHAALPERRKALELLSSREEIRSGKINPNAFRIEGPTDRESLRGKTLPELALDQRAALATYELPELNQRMQATLAALERAVGSAPSPPGKPAPTPPKSEGEDPFRQQLTSLLDILSDQMLQLTLIQAAARLDAVSLTWIDMSPEEAFRIARANRPDWMNARAAVVDAWRQIEVVANSLQSNLNLTFSGDVNTVNNNPLEFRGSTGRLRVGLEFDAPLTRVAERNAYRAAQIAYQQTRRRYYAFEDSIHQSLRATLRDIRLAQLDFELRRAAVFVAITQLDLTRLGLQRPPRPGETGQLGATTARDLLQASSALLTAQNNFLNAWLNYEVQRMGLDFDLGTMRLDENGMWIDPGPIQPGYAVAEAVDDPAPAPLPPNF
jgi:outer membrane protein TolC